MPAQRLCLKLDIDYVDKNAMSDFDCKNINEIKYLIDFISFDEASVSGIKLVQGDKLTQLLELIPIEALAFISSRISSQDIAPPLDHHEFRNWAIRKRRLAKMSQTELAVAIGIRPEQICRFERGQRPLALEHLAKIAQRFAR